MNLKAILKKMSQIIPDRLYICLKYFSRFNKFPNLRNPKTLNEKMQWLKLYDRNSQYTAMVDKYEAKKYVANLIGEEYIIPTIGIWNSFDEIDFSKLPNQFVLKCTHNSGGLFICKNKECMDYKKVKAQLNSALKKNYYKAGREWPYKNVKPRIIAETYMEDTKTAELRDYKFFCFNGEPKLLFIATQRQTEGEETKFDFFDMNFSHLPVCNGHPNANTPPEKPCCFDEMKRLAVKLSKNIPLLRVDFYEVNEKVYFGELTFFHWSGMMPFDPPEWDEQFGSWLELPSLK